MGLEGTGRSGVGGLLGPKWGVVHLEIKGCEIAQSGWDR